MAKIDYAAIANRVSDYFDSSAGRRQIEGKMKELSQTGKHTVSGGFIPSDSKINAMADELVELLNDIAGSYGLPVSVLAHIKNSTTQTKKLMFNTSQIAYEIDITFGGDVSRPSLYPEKYDGVKNIVQLFNTGYMAKNSVFGYWHGRQTVSLRSRPALYFMQKAVIEFENKYRRQFDIQIKLQPWFDY